MDNLNRRINYFPMNIKTNFYPQKCKALEKSEAYQSNSIVTKNNTIKDYWYNAQIII